MLCCDKIPCGICACEARCLFFHLFDRKPVFCDDEIRLIPSSVSPADESCGIRDGYTFRIFPLKGKEYMGYISLRIGESDELYYLGHIGYRIEEKYRGHGYAARACQLIKPLCERLYTESITITANPENIPSRKTCEKIGCILESIVKVPQRYKYICMDAEEKCRYIWYTGKQDED